MPIEFMPVFLALTSEKGAPELLFPNCEEIPSTGEAPYGFDGGWIYASPPIYPCVVVSTTGLQRRVPNRTLRDARDWRLYRAEYSGRCYWTYKPGPEHIDENMCQITENKARGNAAMEALSSD